MALSFLSLALMASTFLTASYTISYFAGRFGSGAVPMASLNLWILAYTWKRIHHVWNFFASPSHLGRIVALSAPVYMLASLIVAAQCLYFDSVSYTPFSGLFIHTRWASVNPCAPSTFVPKNSCFVLWLALLVVAPHLWAQ